MWSPWLECILRRDAFLEGLRRSLGPVFNSTSIATVDHSSLKQLSEA